MTFWKQKKLGQISEFFFVQIDLESTKSNFAGKKIQFRPNNFFCLSCFSKKIIEGSLLKFLRSDFRFFSLESIQNRPNRILNENNYASLINYTYKISVNDFSVSGQHFGWGIFDILSFFCPNRFFGQNLRNAQMPPSQNVDH